MLSGYSTGYIALDLLFLLGALSILGLIVWTPFGIIRGRAQEKRRRELEAQERARAESMDAMNSRSIVAGFIQRADFLHLSDQGFSEWLEANEGYIFPHEREAMERQRDAHRQEKPFRRQN